MIIFIVIALDNYGSAIVEGFQQLGDAQAYLDSLDPKLRAWIQKVNVNA